MHSLCVQTVVCAVIYLESVDVKFVYVCVCIYIYTHVCLCVNPCVCNVPTFDNYPPHCADIF